MKNLRLLDCDVKIDFENVEGFERCYSIEKVDSGYMVKQTIKNCTDKTLKLYGLKVKFSGICFDANPEDDYFYSNENARRYGNYTIPLDYNVLDDGADENKKFGLAIDRSLLDPEVEDGKICSSPYMPFPAVLISNYNVNNGVVCGSLSQDYFAHSFTAKHVSGKIELTVFSEFKSIDYREVLSGEQLIDEFYIGQTFNADDINKIFDEYVRLIRQKLKNNRGASGINRHSVAWDSWNDGIYRNVSEQMLIEEAKAIKKYFPTVEWFQLDDGYSTYCHENVDFDSHGIGVIYEGETGVDKQKFPNGLKAYTDKIKKIGLKPSIWVGGFCPVNTKIYKERPDWFIDYRYRIDWTQPLDVSKSEVRDYMTKALDKFITEYGFEGIKHDFWSYAFEDRHNLLKNKDKSGYEHREWWLSQFTKRLPEYGYLETGCDLSLGNPFLGKYVNNYRFGLDVGAGEWRRIKINAFWATAILSTHTGDLLIPNSDSVGLLPNLSDTDFIFIVNFQIITRTLVEISGRFSLVDKDNPRLKILQRALKYINNGEDCYFANFDYRKKGQIIPEIIYINSAFDCADDGYITVGVFNAEETEKKISFSLKDLNLTDCEHEVEYVWENKIEKQKDFQLTLQPHGSVLLKIKK